jgi:hypothetical protein
MTKQIFWKSATSQDFIDAEILDWIEGVGEVSTQYEKNFVNTFGEVIKQHDSSIRNKLLDETITHLESKRIGLLQVLGDRHSIGILDGTIAYLKSLRKGVK